MIGKQIKGTDFYCCLDYVLGKEGAELIGGNMVGETPVELSQEFQLSLQRHERIRTKKPTRKVVYHATLSVPASETLEDETWCAIAQDYLQGMQFDDNQHILVRHTDTDHNHIHIVASRLRLNGSTVSEWQDYKRSEELIRELENKYQLTPTPSSDRKERRSPTTGECRLTARTGETSIRKKLQDTIDQLSQDSPAMPKLIQQLQDQGIDVRVLPTPTGEMGISYQLDGIAFSGTHLGKAYTFKGLQKYRGVSYSEQQDIEQECDRLSSQVTLEQVQQRSLLTLQNEQKQHLEQEDKSITDAALTKQQPSTTDGNNHNKQGSTIINTLAQQLLPESNEDNWQAVQDYLVGDRYLPQSIVELLHKKGWLYANDESQPVFISRTLEGELTGAFLLNQNNIFSSISLESNAPAFTDDSNTTLTGYFWVATLRPIQRTVITSDPIEVLAVMALDPDFNKTPTLYLAINSGNQIPKEFLDKLSTVVVGLKGDEEGHALSEEIIADLPQARRINPGIDGWNQILINRLEKQQYLDQQQRHKQEQI